MNENCPNKIKNGKIIQFNLFIISQDNMSSISFFIYLGTFWITKIARDCICHVLIYVVSWEKLFFHTCWIIKISQISFVILTL